MQKKRGLYVNLASVKEVERTGFNLKEVIPEGLPTALFVAYIIKRVKRDNSNFVGIITGDPGKGKSYAALRLGELLDPIYTEDVKEAITRVSVAKVHDFLVTVKRRLEGDLDKGSVVILDEGGVAASSRTWWDEVNISLSLVSQMYRKLNLVTLITVPKERLIDVHVRSLNSFFIEMVKIDRGSGFSYARPYYEYEYFFNRSKTVERYLSFVVRAGGSNSISAAIDRIRFRKPGRELVKLYEEKKDRELAQLIGKAAVRVGMIEGVSPEKLGRDIRFALSERERAVYDLLVAGYGIAEIGRQLGLGYNSVKAIQSRLFRIGALDPKTLLEVRRKRKAIERDFEQVLGEKPELPSWLRSVKDVTTTG